METSSYRQLPCAVQGSAPCDADDDARMAIELLRDGGTWSAVVERGGKRLAFTGLRELIAHLERLAAEPTTHRVHGLR